MNSGEMKQLVIAIVAAICLVAVAPVSRALECPLEDDIHDNVTLLSNPFNCSTFFACAQGTPVEMACPAGLEFNDELKVCDYPEKAGCVQLPPAEPEDVPEETDAPAIVTEKIIVKKTVTEIIRPVET